MLSNELSEAGLIELRLSKLLQYRGIEAQSAGTGERKILQLQTYPDAHMKPVCEKRSSSYK
jgi:hypothetical protein